MAMSDEAMFAPPQGITIEAVNGMHCGAVSTETRQGVFITRLHPAAAAVQPGTIY